jgi:holo-ACP synthase
MKGTSNTLNEILEAKEKRMQIQKELLNMFKTTLISFTLNIPGAEKNNESFAKLYNKGICLLEEELKECNMEILHKMLNISAAGPEAFLNVNADALAVKRATVFIEENHELGRLFDFDVFTETGNQISRTELGLPERKCLLCNDNAKVCGRGRRHSTEELLNKIYELMDEFL